MPHGGNGPSLAQWDRISREAGVVRGIKQWRDRMNLLTKEQSGRLADLEAEADDSTLARRKHISSELVAAERMLDRVSGMERETRPPTGAGWPQLVATVEGVVAALPADERARQFYRQRAMGPRSSDQFRYVLY